MKLLPTIAAICVFLVSLTLLSYIAFYKTDNPSAVTWTFFFILTGLSCMSLCAFIPLPSTGVYENHALGIKLGGGAGIGACFIILAWSLACNPPSPIEPIKYRVFNSKDLTEIADYSLRSFSICQEPKGCKINQLNKTTKYLVSFDNKETEYAKIKVLVFDRDKGDMCYVFKVPRLEKEKVKLDNISKYGETL